MDVIPIMRPWLGAEEAVAVGGVSPPAGWLRALRSPSSRPRCVAALGAPHGVATTSCTTGAAPSPARARCRPRRRGRRALAVVHRHDERAALRRRATRVRRRRLRDAEPHGGDGRARAQPVDARGDRRPPGGHAGRRGRDRARSASRAASRSSRTPLARSARHTAAVPSGRATTSWCSASIPASSSPRERAACSLTSDAALARRLRRLREHGMAVIGARSARQPVRGRRGVRGARLQLPHDGPAGGGRASCSSGSSTRWWPSGARSPSGTATRLRTSPGLHPSGRPAVRHDELPVLRRPARRRARQSSGTPSCRNCSIGASPPAGASWPPISNRPARTFPPRSFR